MQLLPSLNDAIASDVAHCPSNFGDVVPELSDLRLQRGDIRIRLVSLMTTRLSHIPSNSCTSSSREPRQRDESGVPAIGKPAVILGGSQDCGLILIKSQESGHRNSITVSATLSRISSSISRNFVL